MAVKNCAGYMSDDTAYNISQLERARQGKSGKSESMETDYSIKSKKMTPHDGEMD